MYLKIRPFKGREMKPAAELIALQDPEDENYVYNCLYLALEAEYGLHLDFEGHVWWEEEVGQFISKGPNWLFGWRTGSHSIMELYRHHPRGRFYHKFEVSDPAFKLEQVARIIFEDMGDEEI